MCSGPDDREDLLNLYLRWFREENPRPV